MKKIVTGIKVTLFVLVLAFTVVSAFPGKSNATTPVNCPDGGTYCTVAYPGGVLYDVGRHNAAAAMQQ